MVIVAGDTKVVERGNGDGCYINTSGLGVVAKDVHIEPTRAQAGDVVIVSGTIGDHGMSIMSVREGLAFESAIESDTAPLNKMVASMLDTCPEIHVLRDPTRGGLAASLNEIAKASACGISIEESALPIDPAVQSACEILGLDPLLVANEGKLLCVAPARYTEKLLAAMRSSDFGAKATVIGRIVPDHAGIVVVRTPIGASRVVSLPMGEQLPRIC